MKSRSHIFPAVVLYLVSAVLLLIYALGDLQTWIRLALLGAGSLALFLAGKALCRTPGAKKGKIMNFTFSVLFALYLHLLFTLTLFDPDFGRTGTVSFLFSDKERMAEYLQTSVNLTPLETIKRYINALEHGKLNLTNIATNLLGNFSVLMPMALFLPILFRKCRRFGWFALTTVLTVVLIEGLQLLFMTGSCDVDDLILNVTGAWFAYLIFQIPPIRKKITSAAPIL